MWAFDWSLTLNDIKRNYFVSFHQTMYVCFNLFGAMLTGHYCAVLMFVMRVTVSFVHGGIVLAPLFENSGKMC